LNYTNQTDFNNRPGGIRLGVLLFAGKKQYALQGEKMTLQPSLPITDNIPTYRMTAVQALAKLRREWEEIAEGENLLDVSASVGLMLADVADRLELSAPERYIFLGKLLSAQVETIVMQQENPIEQ
jgi:hypothetical protein